MKSGQMQVITGIAALCAIVAAVFGATQLFATDEELKGVYDEVQLVSERLDKKIIMDQIHDYENRIYDYDKKYGPNCARCTQEQKDTYHYWKQKLRDLERELSEKG